MVHPLLILWYGETHGTVAPGNAVQRLGGRDPGPREKNGGGVDGGAGYRGKGCQVPFHLRVIPLMQVLVRGLLCFSSISEDERETLAASNTGNDRSGIILLIRVQLVHQADRHLLHLDRDRVDREPESSEVILVVLPPADRARVEKFQERVVHEPLFGREQVGLVLEIVAHQDLPQPG